jgi:tetratricopeptide (TPR) repeat protein
MHPRWLVLTAALAAAAALVPVAGAGAACGVGDASRHARAGELALAWGDWPQAARDFACAAAGSADPDLAERATRVAFDNHQFGAAAQAARRWLELQPVREEARRYLATSLLRLHRADEAGEQFALVLDAAYGDRAQGYTALLATLSGEGNDTGAAVVMERLAAGDPDLAEAHYARSVLWQQAEHGERSLAAARRAIELKPGWRLAELTEVRALLLLGRIEEGLGRAAALAADGDPLTQLNHAWLLAGAERDEDARAAFEGLRRNAAALPQALEGLGVLAYAGRDYEAARRHFAELAQGSRGDETALAYLGQIADRQDKPALAVRYLERVDTGPRAVASQLKAHELMVRLGAAERAEQVLDDFLDQSPASARDVVTGRANQLADAGRGDEAVALMRRASAFFPDDDDFRLAEAFLLEKLDRIPDAVALMRDVLARRPDDPTALNSLGYTLVDRTRQAREGHELIQRALAAKPDSYAIMDSAGWALFRLKRNAEALQWLERAWDRSQDPEVAAHLGEVLWAEGRRDDARRRWVEALEKAPENRSLRQTLQRHPG